MEMFKRNNRFEVYELRDCVTNSLVMKKEKTDKYLLGTLYGGNGLLKTTQIKEFGQSNNGWKFVVVEPGTIKRIWCGIRSDFEIKEETIFFISGKTFSYQAFDGATYQELPVLTNITYLSDRKIKGALYLRHNQVYVLNPNEFMGIVIGQNFAECTVTVEGLGKVYVDWWQRHCWRGNLYEDGLIYDTETKLYHKVLEGKYYYQPDILCP